MHRTWLRNKLFHLLESFNRPKTWKCWYFASLVQDSMMLKGGWISLFKYLSKVLSVEPFCCMKLKKKPIQKNCFGNRRCLKAELVLVDHLHCTPSSFRTNLDSFRTIRLPLFPKPVSLLGLFCRFLQQGSSNAAWKKGYLPNLLESALLHQIFVFWIRDFKQWLLAYFLISFNCAKFQQDWTTFILDILYNLAEILHS